MTLEVIHSQEVLGKEFKVYGTKEEPLFLAKDVAEWIDYSVSNTSKMLNKVDEDEKTTRTISTNGSYVTEAWFLTEHGVYEVLMQSRKPIAKTFKKEVKNILKQIRLTGGYIPVKEEETTEEFLARAYLIAQETLKKKDALLAQKEQKLIEQAPKVEYYENILNSDRLLTITDIAKDLGISGAKLNKILHNAGVIFPRMNYYNGSYTKVWYPYAKYQFLTTEGYADYHIHDYGQTLKWTEKGRQWIINKYNELKTA